VVLMILASTAVGAQTPTPTPPSVDPRLGCSTVKDFPEPDLGEPQNIDVFKKQLLYYRCKAYEDDVARVLDAAQKWVAARAPQVTKPAIVLDIDETSLTNWPRIIQDDFAYIPNGSCDLKVGDPCGDLDWQQSAAAQALQPTLKFYKAARCIDAASPCTPVDVFFITGRREIVHNNEKPSDWTLRNLKLAGYGDIAPDHLYMREADSGGGVSDYKTSKRIDVESRGFVIIASVGDQKSDLAGGHAEMTFKVPNPFYFIP
jgi:HAD superfamily, subfamily IIIB (Acid phosphatase)